MATMAAREIVELTLRRLRVLSAGETASGDDYRDAEIMLAAMFSELVDKEGWPITFALDAVPEWAQLPLAQMLAFEIAPEYGIAVPRTQWWEGRTRIRRHLFPSDLPLRGDIDEDGTVSESEADLADRSVFF